MSESVQPMQVYGRELPQPQLVSSRQISLDYEIKKIGPSGVGKVELWITSDDGKTWKRFAEDPQLKSPMTVELPGEGVFGLRLLIQSQAGLGKPPPIAGDPPEMRVEVDTTRPEVTLYAPEPDPNRQNVLILSWLASDRNLAPNPVAIEYTENPDQPWQVIAKELPNTGRYSWTLPAGIQAQVYLRISVRDQAGNVGVAETKRPELVDLSVPEGRLLGVNRQR
jgi:hypothetical protein